MVPLGIADRYELMGAIHSWVCPDPEVEADRREVFKRNAFLRDTAGVRKTEAIRHALEIPTWDRALMGRINPAVESKDAKEVTNAWLGFLRHPASKPYRMT